MSEQTALQYFLCGLIDLEIGKGIPTDKEIQLKDLYKKAREIEKQQIEESFKNGNMPTFIGNVLTAEQYYNETYGK